MENTDSPSTPEKTLRKTNSGYASFGRRGGAYFLDAIILFPIGMIINFIMFNILPDPSLPWVAPVFSLISLVIAGIYLIAFWVKMDGQTPGKALFKIRIVRDNELPMDVKSA